MPSDEIGPSVDGNDRKKVTLYSCPSPDCMVTRGDPQEIADHVNDEHPGEWDGPDWPDSDGGGDE